MLRERLSYAVLFKTLLLKIVADMKRKDCAKLGVQTKALFVTLGTVIF